MRRIKYGLVILYLIFFLIYLYHQRMNRLDEGEIQSYGQIQQVYDSDMTVLIEGKGEKTIVLLSGYGTASPVLDYQPLIDELKTDYRVVVIEPFGYGLSGQTNRARTLDNVTEEIHEVLQQLDVTSYILMGHSISGYYGLAYTNKYPEEVTHFVGLDSSVPNQLEEKIPTTALGFLSNSGLLRLAMRVNPGYFFIDHGDVNRRRQYELLSNKNIGNRTVRAEGKALASYYQEVKSLTFPKQIPVLLLIAQESVDKVSGWKELHDTQVSKVSNGKVRILPGSHYLHHTQSRAIHEELTSFLYSKKTK